MNASHKLGNLSFFLTIETNREMFPALRKNKDTLEDSAC